MKLRLEAGSLRLRVLRSEVAALQAGKVLQVTLRFGSEKLNDFTYSLQGAQDLTDATIHFDGRVLTVLLPANQVQEWASSETVGIYAQVDCNDGITTRVMVEKDFACLDRSDDENVDTFANPKAIC